MRANKKRRPKDRGIDKLRRVAYIAQKGKCYYCEQVMWESSFETKEAARVRLQIEGTGKKGRWKKATEARRCTGEHIIRVADGGTVAKDNIVAACLFCNTNRGDTPVEEWKEQRRNVYRAEQIASS